MSGPSLGYTAVFLDSGGSTDSDCLTGTQIDIPCSRFWYDNLPKTMLQPLDILVALKLALNEQTYTQAELAHELDVSASQVNRALKSCRESGLIEPDSMKVHRKSLNEFLLHGIKYAYPGKVGKVERGLPTAHSAAPLKKRIRAADRPLVWPDPDGRVRGESVEPLYRNAVYASRRDAKMYEALALLDAIRIGRARERKLAAEMITKMLLSDDA